MHYSIARWLSKTNTLDYDGGTIRRQSIGIHHGYTCLVAK